MKFFSEARIDRNRRNPISPIEKSKDIDTNDEQSGEDMMKDQELQEEAKNGGNEDEFKAVGCEGEEVAKSARTPKRPTQQEIEDHELSHCPPRSWCDHCVKGQMKDDPSKTVTGELAESDVIRVKLDYCFLTEDVHTKGDEHQQSTTARTSLIVLVMIETLCRSIWAYAVRRKGAAKA